MLVPTVSSNTFQCRYCKSLPETTRLSITPSNKSSPIAFSIQTSCPWRLNAAGTSAGKRVLRPAIFLRRVDLEGGQVGPVEPRQILSMPFWRPAMRVIQQRRLLVLQHRHYILQQQHHSTPGNNLHHRVLPLWILLLLDFNNNQY